MCINVNALFDALARILERKENVTIRVKVERREENEKNGNSRICGD